ncbi:hypothetical protein QFZ75_006074 [Streptomyces sp. V3I8]|uniref:hypothetical protein n=1 Tax=Streptomyces sp. V3I8 TaxID=3042279 RepID=UPI002789296E|nr:hypothetical protein [Streptomyces sp. V3I8]MDQ1039658.1 hypothetical protein [Streptomyces sp. V3I8]
MKIDVASRRRIEIFELRLRIELATVKAYDRVCQPESPLLYINDVSGRLSLVIGLVPHEEIMEAVGLVRLAKHVYSRSSDILHGRSSMVDAPGVIIDEWRTIVERLEIIVGAQQPADSV